jgi:hypothetical protein
MVESCLASGSAFPPCGGSRKRRFLTIPTRRLPRLGLGRAGAARAWIAGFAIALGMIAPASAAITIRGARIAEGDLLIIGQVDEPNTTVSLDDSYFEKTDSRGRFEFRLGYHPATCTVILKTEKQVRVVVVGNCGQRGPAGPEGPPGAPAPVAAPALPRNEAARPDVPRSEISCGLKAALYEAANGFRMWVTRKGLLRASALPQRQTAQQDLVLQVSINGGTASLRGPSFSAMTRGGPPQEIEQAARQPINWERLTDALPEVIEVVPDGGTGVLARLTFKECGSPPRAVPPSPSAKPDAERMDAPPSRPLPQGAL